MIDLEKMSASQVLDALSPKRKLFESLSKYQFELGVIDNSKVKRKTRLGINNAELMFIHENGSPLRHIPRRPVLELTLAWANNKGETRKLVNYLSAGIFSNDFDETDIEKALKQFAIKLENHARVIIYSNNGQLVPNAPSVAKKKGGSHPLFDTGQLARSITCQVVKEGHYI